MLSHGLKVRLQAAIISSRRSDNKLEHSADGGPCGLFADGMMKVPRAYCSNTVSCQSEHMPWQSSARAAPKRGHYGIPWRMPWKQLFEKVCPRRTPNRNDPASEGIARRSP